MTTLMSKERFFDYAQEKRPGPYAAVTAAMAALAFTGYKKLETATAADRAHVDDEMRIASYYSDEGAYAFHIDTGLFQDERRVLEKVRPALARYGSIHVLRHGPDDDDNRARVLDLIRQDEGRELLTISMSKGGLDRFRLQLDPAFREKQGPIKVMGLESALFAPQHMTRRGSAMIRTGRAVPQNHFSSWLFQKRVDSLEKRNTPGFVRDTNDLSFYTAQTAAETLMTYRYPDVSFADAFSARNVGHVMMIAAKNDRLVKTREAAQWFADHSDREVLYGVDSERPARNHAGLPAYSNFYTATLDMVLGGNDIPLGPTAEQNSPYALLTPQEPVQ